MKINGVDISTKNMKLLKRDITPSEVTNEFCWSGDMLLPSTSDFNSRSFTTIDITIDCICKTNSEVEINKSWLSKQLTTGEFQFDDIFVDYKFFFISDSPITCSGEGVGYQSFSFSVKGYFYKDVVKNITDPRYINIDVLGNRKCPVKIEVNVSNCNNLIISGGCFENIKISGIDNSETIVIDGIKCAVSGNKNDVISRTELWEFPCVDNINYSVVFTPNNVVSSGKVTIRNIIC